MCVSGASHISTRLEINTSRHSSMKTEFGITGLVPSLCVLPTSSRGELTKFLVVGPRGDIVILTAAASFQD